jgi:GWxTD domain-containing protein
MEEIPMRGPSGKMLFSQIWWRCRFSCSCVALLLVLHSGLALAERNKNEKLPKFYSNWLNRDVAYIITKPERKAFLELETDETRDKFIERFWAIRNPTPGSPDNAYKDEIYERIAYADAHFGIGSGEEGWRTDRGRTYITLGKPQQTRQYLGAPNLRPIEIWFYSNTNPALPSFFNVLFYQRDSIGDFRYYSPTLDGPDKLVTGMEAINDPQSALKLIQSSVGPEVAHVAQSLIPGEPLDPDGRISLQSDVMLSVLKNLANQPSNIDDINRRREMVEMVTSRMILDSRNLDIVLFPARDPRGITRVNYAIRLGQASDLTLVKKPDGLYAYSIEVRVQVYSPDNKLIFTQQKSVSGNLDQERLDDVRDRRFGYEGILPLPPGKYHLDFLVTDWNQKVGFHADREVTIPANNVSTFVVPAVMAFSKAEAVDRGMDEVTPFASAGLRFRPIDTAPLVFNESQDLNVVYEIWAPANNPIADTSQQLQIQYALGQPALVGTAVTSQDTADMSQFTSSGTLVNGKKFSLVDKPVGNYMLTVSVKSPGSAERTYSSLSFQLLNDVHFRLPWDFDEPGIEEDEAKGILEQQRALCYLVQGQPTEARRWFRVALNKDHGDDVARSRLVEAYYGLNAYSAVVSLLNDAGITSTTDSGTIVQMAESLLKTGNAPKAVSLLQSVIHDRPDDGPLYLALADSYQQMGNTQEATEMSRKGKSLLAAGSKQ